MSVGTRESAPDSAAPGTDDRPWHAFEVARALAEQDADEQRGLTAAEAASRASRFGRNRLAAGEEEPRWRAFGRQYLDVMQVVLLVAGLVSLYPLKQLETGILLVALTIFNAVLGLRQEGKAASAVAALQQMMILTAKVTRDGELTEVPAEAIVPGDMVAIEAGDVVPADGRLVTAATLEVAESALTGESLPVSKGVEPVASPDTPLGDRTDMVYMNTHVTRGSGRFLVTATGMATEVGHISSMLSAEKPGKSPLTRQLDRLTNQILIIAGVALAVSMALNLRRGDSFDVVFAAAVAFAIGAIPENLPAVVTTILAYGTQALAKAGAIMKRLQSTETLGSTSAINSDKTGTLTLNEMTAVRLSLVGRSYAVQGTGYSSEGRIERVAGQPVVDLDEFLLPMVLASDAVVTDGRLVGDPTEGALVALAAKGGIDSAATREAYPRLAVLPFDAEYKLMATFHRMTDRSGREVVRCYVKGAPDQLLARAATVYDADGGTLPVDEKNRGLYLEENRRLGVQGLRVLATGRKDLDPLTFDPNGDLLAVIDGLELLGLIGIVDPPRPSAKASIALAKSAGIRVRMITGDHAVTAAAIADGLGIEGRVLTGAEFAAMSDQEALEQVDEVGVIARVTPEDKVRLVDLLKQRGDIVAMTGDGVNDAPALKRADIGIAMGIAGTEVTKEAAVMVLTDDDFSTIVKAVELGRGLYDNLVKYIRFQMGCLFGFIVAFLGASILDIAGGVPFTPVQTLWVNFTTLLFMAVGLGYGEAGTGLMSRKPRRPDQPLLSRSLMSWLVFVGLIGGTTTLWVVGVAGETESAAVAHTMGLVTFSLFALFFSFAAKDDRRTMFTSDTVLDKTFLRMAGLTVLTLIASTAWRPLQTILDTASLSADQWGVCLLVAAAVVVASEIQKLVLGRRSVDRDLVNGAAGELVAGAAGSAGVVGP